MNTTHSYVSSILNTLTLIHQHNFNILVIILQVYYIIDNYKFISNSQSNLSLIVSRSLFVESGNILKFSNKTA